jgi:hypothetical protein
VKPAYVRGLGLWTPGYADPAAWRCGNPDPTVEAPEAALLSGSLRRRSSSLTRMAIEALQQATTGASFDPANTPSIWATAHGEHAIALAMFEMMRSGEGKLSPTHFHNSVHNTASGYASIATRNCSPSTTLTGGDELVAAAFLEAFCCLDVADGDVVLVLADESLRPPFDGGGGGESLAVAFCLSTRPDGAAAVLSVLRRDDVPPLKHHECFGSLYVSAALPLLERIARRRPGNVALEFEREGTRSITCVDLALVGS